MKRWWVGAALAAVCVGQSAWGQQPPGDGGLLPEPAAVAPCPPQGQFVPGPLTGGAAPPGPGDALSLPASLPTAWGKGPPPESGAYFHLGAMGLMRQRPGHGEIATDGGQTGVSTHDIDPKYQWGPRVTFGYLYDNAAIELTGFYLPDTTTTVTRTDPGNLSSFFFNAPNGFQGVSGAGPFQQTDRVALSLQTSLGSAELNYRWWSRAFTGFEGIFGFRFVELQERARVFTDQGALLAGLTGTVDPTLQATYTSRVHNHLLLGQFGFEWTQPVCSWLSTGVMMKGAFGADDVDVTTQLQRGDGIIGASGRRNHWTYSGLYEIDAFIDVVEFDKVRVRAGYAAMWVVHVDEGFQAIDYNLASQPGPNRDSGSVFYHGPMIEVQILF